MPRNSIGKLTRKVMRDWAKKIEEEKTANKK